MYYMYYSWQISLPQQHQPALQDINRQARTEGPAEFWVSWQSVSQPLPPLGGQFTVAMAVIPLNNENVSNVLQVEKEQYLVVFYSTSDGKCVSRSWTCTEVKTCHTAYIWSLGLEQCSKMLMAMTTAQVFQYSPMLGPAGMAVCM